MPDEDLDEAIAHCGAEIVRCATLFEQAFEPQLFTLNRRVSVAAIQE